MNPAIKEKKNTRLKKVVEFFKNRWMKENSPSSEEKTFQPRQFFLDFGLVLLGAAFSICLSAFIISIKKVSTKNPKESIAQKNIQVISKEEKNNNWRRTKEKGRNNTEKKKMECYYTE